MKPACWRLRSIPRLAKAVDWAGTLERQNVSWGNNRQFNPVPDDSEHAPLAGLNADKPWPKFITDLTGRGLSTHTAFLNADGVNAVISFLNKYGKRRSFPRREP